MAPASTQNRKQSFIKITRRWTIASLIALGIILLAVHSFKTFKEAESRAEQMRAEYAMKQRELIKFEVDRAVEIIDYEIEKCAREAKTTVKNRVYSAHAIARNLYDRNIAKRTDEEIKGIIIDALRPIRFDDGSGYYFIGDFDLFTRLSVGGVEQENVKISTVMGEHGLSVIKDMVDIVKSKGEGSYSYYWTRPGNESEKFEKVAFVKHFKPFDWFIGTGVYVDTIEDSMQEVIAHYVKVHRFGANDGGYVFVNEVLNIHGGRNFAKVYANPNRPDDTGKMISDDYRDAKGKMFRKEFLQGLRDHGECYIDYWYKKIGQPKPSPKTSYFKLAGNGRFIVAAGVYLDDVEGQISQMQAALKKRLKSSLFIIFLIFISAITAAIVLFNVLSRSLESDYQLFIDFFRRAADSSELIDRENVRFAELDQLAGFANQMLEKKTETENSLREERERLVHTISEREEAREAALTQTQRFNVFFGSINDAIFVHPFLEDGFAQFVEVNDIACERYGYTRSEFMSLAVTDITEKKYLKRINLHENRRKLGEKGQLVFEAVHIKKSGESFPVEINRNIIEQYGKQYILTVVRDITERKQAENHQRSLEKKLIQSQKMEAIGTLAGGIAHDFNNILSGVLGYTELAINDVREMPNTKRKLDQVLKACGRATDLVRQILIFSRDQQSENKPLNPVAIVKEVLKFIRSSIPASIEIKQSFESEKYILADATKIHQVMMNLCTNAAHAMTLSGGVLSVTIQEVYLKQQDMAGHPDVDPGDFLQISVKDTGVGISEEIQKKVFDPFFTTKEPGEGTGMGLSTVHGIIADLKGFVSLYSEEGQGTIIHLFIPLISESSDDQRMLVQEGFEGGSERILLVDDEQILLDLMEETLSQYGYKPTAISDSTEALTHFQDNPEDYDLVITDVTMPKMTGDKLTQMIHLIRPEIPVIACTGFSKTIDERKAADLNIKAFLHKPIVTNDILKTIREVLDQSQAS